MKKVLTAVLAMVLLLALLPCSAFATEVDESEKDIMKEMLMNYLTTGTTGNKDFDVFIKNYLENGTTGNVLFDNLIKEQLGGGDCGIVGQMAWMLDGDGKLRIFGSGEMPDYTQDAPAPWGKYAEQIKVLTIEGEITVIGANAFANCVNLTEATIRADVAKLASGVFAGCEKLEKVTFEGDMPVFAEDVFTGVTATCYRPEENATWTGMGSYGGTITWKVIGEDDVKPGDVNGDGKLNAKDATAILKKIVGKLENPVENFDKIADVNGDTKVNAKDATKILKTIVGKDSIEGWEK